MEESGEEEGAPVMHTKNPSLLHLSPPLRGGRKVSPRELGAPLAGEVFDPPPSPRFGSECLIIWWDRGGEDTIAR